MQEILRGAGLYNVMALYTYLYICLHIYSYIYAYIYICLYLKEKKQKLSMKGLLPPYNWKPKKCQALKNHYTDVQGKYIDVGANLTLRINHKD